MENAHRLPFKVGDLAEAKSFQQGFRGAWFRCKIKKIGLKKGVTAHLLEFYDYPDEKFEWTKIYQFPTHVKGKGKHRELMVRPCYPPIYNEDQMPMPDINLNSEVAVIIDNSWKVGDLVDWWNTNCFWTGTITELLGDDKGKMLLIPRPVGEGELYDILLKDIRPTLDWSPEFGWTMPTRGNRPACSCARLIKLTNHVPRVLQTMDTCNSSDKTEADPGASAVGLSLASPVSSNSLAVSDDAKGMEKAETVDIQRRSLGLQVSKDSKDAQGESKILILEEKANCANADSGCTTAEVAEDNHDSRSSSKKFKVSKGDGLYSKHPDTLEAAILDLEENLNRVKWLQRILKHGISSSNTLSSQWKFLEPGAPS